MTSDWHVEVRELELNESFRIAHGSSSMRQVVRVHHGDAVGEAPFVPYYHEDIISTLRWLEKAAEAELSDAPTRAARLALELVRLDAAGRRAALPLSAYAEGVLQGLPARHQVYGCRSLSIPEDWTVFENQVSERAARFGILKLKLGSGAVVKDLEIVARARRIAPSSVLIADVNGGWTVDETVKLLPQLAEQGLALLEQPFHHDLGIGAWKQLRAAIGRSLVPIYADESAQSIEEIRALSGLADGVNVKLLKSQGFIAAAEWMREAKALGLGVLLGCMIETSIGTTAAAHLAPWADWVDLDGHLYLVEDDYHGIEFGPAGLLKMPSRSGIGAAPKRLT